MKMRCWGCGTPKDTKVLEVYPYPEEEHLTDKPIAPLLILDCQPSSEEEGDHFRVVVVCHECFHRLDPDMWIGSNCWKKLDPKVPFHQLPLYDEFDAANGRRPEDYIDIEVGE